LYNEHSGQAILPTPVVGMVGVIDNDKRVMSGKVKQAGHKLALIGRFKPTLGGSQYQTLCTGRYYGPPPMVSLRDEVALNTLLLDLIKQQTIQSAHDLSEGGLLVALLETLVPTSAHKPILGADIDLSLLQALTPVSGLDALLFGETHGSVLVSYDPNKEQALLDACKATLGAGQQPLDAFILGAVVANPNITIEDQSVTLSVQALVMAWKSGLQRAL
jgi:phosphoribosylformylglycinamidine synthase subunit PurL